MKAEIEFKGALQSVDVKSGDRFVLKLDAVPTSSQAVGLLDQWRDFAGDAKLLLLMPGCELTAIREEEPKPNRFGALASVFERWRDGHAFDDDSEEDESLLHRASAELSQ